MCFIHGYTASLAAFLSAVMSCSEHPCELETGKEILIN